MAKFTGRENHEEVRKECLGNLRDVVSGLESMIKKIESGERCENEDWIPIAVKFNEIMNPLMNAWYLQEEER